MKISSTKFNNFRVVIYIKYLKKGLKLKYARTHAHAHTHTQIALHYYILQFYNTLTESMIIYLILK